MVKLVVLFVFFEFKFVLGIKEVDLLYWFNKDFLDRLICLFGWIIFLLFWGCVINGGCKIFELMNGVFIMFLKWVEVFEGVVFVEL